MNIFCGTDIIEIERIKSSIETLGDNFINKIYTEKEIEYCESKKNVKYQHYAARFAAKEAIFKAVSNMLNNKYDISWKDVEILNNGAGRPYINFIDEKVQGLQSVDISISHCKEYTTAIVIISY